MSNISSKNQKIDLNQFDFGDKIQLQVEPIKEFMFNEETNWGSYLVQYRSINGNYETITSTC